MKIRLPKTLFGLTFLFAVIIFCALAVTVAAAAVVTFFVVRSDIIPTTKEMVPIIWTTCAIMLGISLLFGSIIAIMASKLPFRPVRELMEGMDRLAGGDFDTRIQARALVRRHPSLAALTESFNKMAQQLQNTEMLRSDFINNFSHEFKTPIVSISGFAKLLRRGDLPEADRQEYLAIIQEESLRLSYMATNVLNLTKLENQTILSDVTRYNVSEQLRHSVLLLEDEWTRKDLELSMDFDEIFITANEEMMKQVFINLLDNAVKFAPQGGCIRVGVAQDEGSTRIEIANNGPEIPAEQRERIFNKFYQGDESRSARGNGIGLAIVRRVTQLHSGTVTVDCGGGWTTFTVRLPERRNNHGT